MRVHLLQHVAFEGPGCIGTWAEEHGYRISVTRFYDDELLPSLDSVDMLIVMGGPMGVYDEVEYPWLIDEKRFIGSAIEQDKVVLGICLGAQLIAAVLGASVYPGAVKEIGWFPVALTEGEGAGADGLFKGIPTAFNCFHWHGDTFDLPAGAKLLASTKAVPHQAFSYEGRVLGLQFHLEATSETIAQMVAHGEHELLPAPYIQPKEEILGNTAFISSGNKCMYQLLDSLQSIIENPNVNTIVNEI